MANQQTKKAAEIYATTHNCAQTILNVCLGEQDPKTQAVLFDAAAGLGGGLASSGSTCGALIGGLMALNLRLVEQEISEKERSRRLKQLVAEFNRQNSSVDCRDLTGMDFTDQTIIHCRQRVIDVVGSVEALSGSSTAGEITDQS